MSKTPIICALALCAGAPIAGYGQVDQSVIESVKQNDRQENLLKIEDEQQANAPGNQGQDGGLVISQATGYCVSYPFPSTPSGIVSQAVINYVGDTFNVKVWRVGCDATNSNVLVRVEPITQPSWVCSASFSVIQNQDQFDAKLSETIGSSFCDDLLVPKTFLLDQWSFGTHFDDDASFDIVWGGTTINVGPYAGAPSGCAQGGVSHYTPATGTLNIPSVELPSGKCYDATLQIIPPYDTLNFTVTGAVKK